MIMLNLSREHSSRAIFPQGVPICAIAFFFIFHTRDATGLHKPNTRGGGNVQYLLEVECTPILQHGLEIERE